MKRMLGVLLVCLLLSGCGETQTVESNRRLNLTATIDKRAYSTISSEDLGGNYTGDIHCSNLVDVAVVLDGKSCSLTQAIADGRITVEELIAYARIDARTGICGEVKKTKNGLTYFVYCYPDYYVYTAYDVYETPQNGDVLISEFGLMAPGGYPKFSGNGRERESCRSGRLGPEAGSDGGQRGKTDAAHPPVRRPAAGKSAGGV